MGLGVLCTYIPQKGVCEGRVTVKSRARRRILGENFQKATLSRQNRPIWASSKCGQSALKIGGGGGDSSTTRRSSLLGKTS